MKSIGIQNFRGLETVPEKGNTNSENCRDIQDISLSRGMLSRRIGYQKFNTTAYSDAITGLYGYKNRWGRFVLDAYGGNINSETVLTPSFVATPQKGDINLTVYFMDTTQDWNAEITTWEWDFGDGSTLKGTTVDEQYPSHIYKVPGIYSVKLTVSTGNASFTCEKANFVESTGLIPDFLGSPLQGDVPMTVAFFDITPAKIYTKTAWAWTFGDGGTSTIQHPTHEYTVAGQYDVALTITTSGASFTRTITDYITVKDPEATTVVADFIGTPVKGEVSLTVQFTDLTVNEPSGATFAWTFGDGGTSTQQSPTHVYTAVGLYTVSLTVNGTYVCSKTAYILVTPVTEPPDVTPPVPSWIIIAGKYRLFFKDKAASASPAGMPNDIYKGWNDGTVTNVAVQTNTAGPGDGKIVTVEGAVGTYVDKRYPDINYSTRTIFTAGYQADFGINAIFRTYIKCLPNKTLHLYGYDSYIFGSIDVHGVDANTFNVNTVTWSTQPTLGSMFFTYTPSVQRIWEEIPTGSTGAICIKISNETLPSQRLWYSSLFSDISLRPYVTPGTMPMTGTWSYAYTFAQEMLPSSLSWNTISSHMIYPTFAWSVDNTVLTITVTFSAADQYYRFLQVNVKAK